MNTKPVALVTGGSRGIGLGVAQHLAKAGFDLVINGRRPESDVKDTISQLTAAGAAVLYCQADVSSREDHAKMLAAIHQRFGRLDALINNAGVAPDVRADILDASPESFDRLVSINLKGPYFLTQSVAKLMVDRRKTDSAFSGKIVFVTSISATVASVNRGDYCISKAGLAMASKLWAVRLAEFGIDVFEVRPGVIATDMTSGVKEKYDTLIAGGLTVQKRWGNPDDIGRAVTMLATGQLTYATGGVLMVDGGLTLERL
jgi:NAD(P)-dependent dehydrogenase (short-subunit alcohol dehydrogenase family)